MTMDKSKTNATKWKNLNHCQNPASQADKDSKSMPEPFPYDKVNQNKRCRNPFTPFWIQVMFSVFRGLKYDDIKPNHAKKNAKNANCTTVHCNAQ